MAIKVDFPMNSIVIFHSYVKLPEGSWFLSGCKVFSTYTHDESMRNEMNEMNEMKIMNEMN